MKNIFSLLVLSSVLLTSWAKDTGAGDSNWFMAQTNAADVKSVIATSELVEAQFSGKYLYPPINILDGNLDSTWCGAQIYFPLPA